MGAMMVRHDTLSFSDGRSTVKAQKQYHVDKQFQTWDPAEDDNFYDPVGMERVGGCRVQLYNSWL